jgi:hypothetical protein
VIGPEYVHIGQKLIMIYWRKCKYLEKENIRNQKKSLYG